MTLATPDDGDRSYQDFLRVLRAGDKHGAPARRSALSLSDLDVVSGLDRPGDGDGSASASDETGNDGDSDNGGDDDDDDKSFIPFSSFGYDDNDNFELLQDDKGIVVMTRDGVYRRIYSRHDGRKSCLYHMKFRAGLVETYHATTYSFLAIHGPLANFKFFAFGLATFVLQIVFLALMMTSLVHPKFRFGENDNPHSNDGGILAAFVPSTANTLTLFTQFWAVVSYCLYCDSSLYDCSRAVEQFPRFDRTRDNDASFNAAFSCVLRFIQGLLATLVTLLLIITTPDVVDIILNFTAVNFISQLDEVAFELAKQGKYGPRLEEEANSIVTRKVPYSMHRKHRHNRHLYAVIPIGFFMLIALVSIVGVQLYNNSPWLTQNFRVQFRDAALHPYSGCYEVNTAIEHSWRKTYHAHAANEGKGVFGYCIQKHRWVLFNDDGEGGSKGNPCTVGDDQLVFSASTNTYDVWSSFGELWFTASGEPLDVYFMEENGSDLSCDAFMYNGKCDKAFNDWEHRYDGGDCCASTCSGSKCGVDGVTDAFEVAGQGGIGYPHCVDPVMKALTIHLTSIRSSRDDPRLRTEVRDSDVEFYRLEKGVEFWEEEPKPAYFIVDCDEDNELAAFIDSSNLHNYNIKKINVLSVYVDKTMVNRSERVLVPDGARCSINVSHTTDSKQEWDSDPIWHVNYTIYHGKGFDNKIVSGESCEGQSTAFHRIPDCYFHKFVYETGLVDLASAYAFDNTITKALEWLVEDNDKSGHSKCDDDFILERAALGALNFAAPIANQTGNNHLWINTQQQCGWENVACVGGSVRTLALSHYNLKGTIDTAIGLLTRLEHVYFDDNHFSGTIPSEIGNLTNLQFIELHDNILSGTIPQTFGNIKGMVELRLDNNELTGTIPLALAKLTNARELNFKYNKLTGPIPTEFGSLTDITMLELSSNLMTGTIPTQLGKLTNTTRLELGDNNFSGSLPAEIGLMTALSLIDLRKNSLGGPIPRELGLLTSLTEIRLEGNSFTGTIPDEITSFEQLRILTFDGSLSINMSNGNNLVPCLPCSGDNNSSTKNIFHDRDPDFSCYMSLDNQEEPISVSMECESHFRSESNFCIIPNSGNILCRVSHAISFIPF